MNDCELRILSQTANGKVFKCCTCSKIHIEYKNLNFNFEREDFEFFRKYFLELDPEHWEEKNKNCFYTRKILVPIGHQSFTAIFNVEEVYEIKSLMRGIFKNNHTNLINLATIGAKLNLN